MMVQTLALVWKLYLTCLRSTLIRRIAKFVLSAGVVWGSDFLIFLLLYSHISLGLAVFAARATGGLVGFALHKWFSFASTGAATNAELFQFGALWLINYAISVGGISAIVGTTTAAPAIAKLIVDIVIFMSNYLLMERIFRAKS